MKNLRQNITGRGASSDPANRFDRHAVVLESYEGDEFANEERDGVTPKLQTQFLKDTSRTIVSENTSPDIAFRYSVNPYRGCEHGCAYCYARPTHEYLGFSAGLDFESKILVKFDAPKLLREKLMSKRWVGESITFSGNTDCYQPVERQLKLTRQCLEVLAEFRNPVSLITKNALITRDLDILSELARYHAVVVYISLTSLDAKLCADLEPRTSRPSSRLEAIAKLTAAGIPVGVNVAPVIPGLNDQEIPSILKAAAAAGAIRAAFTPLRLPLAVAPLFEEWLEVHRPLRKEKILNLIRDVRGGKLNDAQFGSRMKGSGAIAENLAQMFNLYARKEGLNKIEIELSSAHFVRPGDQLTFF